MLTPETVDNVQVPEFKVIPEGNVMTILELVGIELPGYNVILYVVLAYMTLESTAVSVKDVIVPAVKSERVIPVSYLAIGYSVPPDTAYKTY